MWGTSCTPVERLNRLWNAQSAAEPVETPPACEVDSALIDALAILYERDDARLPDPRFLDRLEQTLLERLAATTATMPLAATPVSLNGRAETALSPDRFAPGQLSARRRRDWLLAQLATAALVLLTLVGSVVALRGARPLMSQEERPAFIPAIEEIPEATTLVDALVTAWPSGGPPFFASIERITFDPGAVEAASTDRTGMGPDLFTVESGQVTVTADGPVVVTRGPAEQMADPTTAAAGTTIVLDVGDRFFAPAEVSFQRRNDAPAPASVLDFQVSDVEPAHHALTVHYQRIMPDKIFNAVPPEPSQIALRRLRLQAGTALPIGELSGLQMLYVEEGTLDLMGERAAGDLVPMRSTSISAGSGTAYFDTVSALVNRGVDPLTVLIATIEPVP
jgi:hypothetical protein